MDALTRDPIFVGYAKADTSRRETRATRGLSNTRRPKHRPRLFFTFTPAATADGKVRAPEGYAFNRRGDLISLKRQARRDRARRAA